MAITTEQRELRRKFIGSSDAPAILGVDPHRSAYDVYLEKTGQADGFEGNADTDRGTLLEPVLIQWAAQQLKGGLVPCQFVVRPDAPALCANLDAFLRPCDDAPGGAVIEAKTATNADEWGDPGTDEVPDRVLIQTHHAMYLVGCRLAFVPVLLPVFGRFDFRLYKVERNDELADVVAQRGIAFWREHVEPRVPPTGCLPSLEVLKRVRRQPNKIIPVPDELVDAVILTRAARKDAEESCKDAEVALLTALGDAEGGQYSRGSLSYLETKRKGYTVEATTFRSLRIKASK
jgi:putative phage-type endonuclease